MVARLVAAAAWVACMGGVTLAVAAEPTGSELLAARELFARAEKDEDAGRWDAALEKVRRAAAVKATAGLRFHMALCEEKLGQLVAALNDYAASDTMARADGNKEVLEAVTDPLAALQARVPTLTVRVRPDVQGAVVTVDGTAVPGAHWGTGMRLEIGRHVVAATAAARQPFNATVSLDERETKIIDVELAPIAAPASALPVAATATSPPPQPSPPSAPSLSRTPALLATAGAVALVGAGVASFLVAGSKQSDAEAQCRQLVSCDDLKGPIRAFDWLALGAWASGAAVGAVAVILWAAPKAPEPARAELVVGPGSAGIRGSF